MLLRFLDMVLLVTMLFAPWVLFCFALSAFRKVLRRDRWLFALFVTGLWFLLLTRFSPLTQVISQQMLHTQTTPWFAAYKQAVLELRSPLWLPQLGVGMPAMANPYTGYFSPFTPVVLFFRQIDQGVNVLLLTHLTFLGTSMLLLGRSLGLRRIPSVLMGLAVVFNPWVFRRLTPEVHAMYALGFAWAPLAWALVMRWLRTRAWHDALRLGVPLAFMAATLATVFALFAFAVAFLAASAAVRPLLHREWSAAGRVAGALVLVVVGVFLTAAPEHLSTVELQSLNEETRLVGKRISGGWRDRPLSALELLRVFLPNEVGARLIPVRHSVAYFGVPFSPGDAVVGIAAVGMIGALAHRSLRRRTDALPHLLLLLVLANVATHGLAYEALHRWYPLWAMTGNWPVLGALFLMIIVIFFGVGVETLARLGCAAGRWTAVTVGRRVSLVALLLRLAIVRWSIVRGIAAFGLVLLVTEMLFGLGGVLRATRGVDPDGRAEMRYAAEVMRLTDFQRMPHLEFLRRAAGDSELPMRIYCTGDRGRWPSPCFDFLVDRYRLETVGPGDFHWALPWWQWRVLSPLWPAWADTFPPLFARLLELQGVQAIVSTRDLGYPLLERVPWNPAPGDFEHWGAVLNNTGGGPWSEGWDQTLWVQAFPKGAPRAFFADAAVLRGNPKETQAVVEELLASGALHPRKILLLHGDASVLGAALPEVDGSLAGKGEREAFFAHHPTRGQPVTKVKLDIRSLFPGAWQITGETPRAGALFVMQLFYPGVRAWVNGRSVSPLRADLFFTAVPVPAGPVSVVVQYAPVRLFLSAFLTLGFSVWALRMLRRRG